jgi:methylmalonyl-CoA mutase
MPDEAPGMQALDIGAEFPPVSTEAWEAVIARDLKGADYEKKLVWRLEDGILVRPYYRSEALAGLKDQLQAGPGQFPFVRGDVEPWQTAEAPPVAAIRADLLHEAGATAVQELGFALAEAVDRLARAPEGGAAKAAGEIDFVFAIGPYYLLEIAKFRAARMLWAQAVAAFGVQDDGACRMRLYARTSRRNKSVYDRYTNLLRVTTEALSAAVGGCDQVYVEPFGFDQHLALGVQRILREESRIDAVADPAGGSYTFEALTDALAREAWALLQKVEAEGGYAQALKSGGIEQAIAQSRASRQKAAASRRVTLVGVNNYPDVKETGTEVKPPAPEASPFGASRLAEPFEAVRQRTERHTLKTGRRPKVLLLKRGDVKMRGARANFSLNFFGCAGFDIADSDTYEGADADLIVLCSSDPEYLALAQEVCPAVKVPVLVAGNPKDQIDALKAAGVQGFVYMGADAIQTFTQWQDRLGMEK